MAEVIQTTYDTIGNREGLTNIVDMISPTDTPLYTMAKKVSATATKHEWQTDALEAPEKNAAVEGATSEATKAKATERLENYTQIFKKDGAVSGTQQAVTHAGISNEKAHQMKKKLAEIKKDMELAFLGNQKATAGTSSTARELRGLTGWITAANSSAGATAAAGTKTAARTKGTARAFTLDMLNDVIESCYEAGGNPTKIIVSPAKKSALTKAAAFGDTVRTQRSADTKSAGAVVDVYVSDFGSLDVIPNRVMKNSDATLDLSDTMFVIDPEHIAIATLRDFKSTDIAKTGDSDKFMITNESTLQVTNPHAHGAVFDLS